MKIGIKLIVSFALLLSCTYMSAQEMTAFRNELGIYGFKQWGEVVIQPKFHHASDFSEGLAAVEMNGKYGYIDASGKCVIPYKFESASSFSEGLAAVKFNGNYGYIDRNGASVIPYKFRGAEDFKDGFAQVLTMDGRNRFVDNTGAMYNNKNEALVKFSSYARQFVEPKVNQWQKKGEFEKTAAWQQRVTETNREKLIDSLRIVAEKEYIDYHASKIGKTGWSIGPYDADGEIYMIIDDRFGELLLNVPIAEAKDFKSNFEYIQRENEYYISNDSIGLSEARFTDAGGHTYVYRNNNELAFTQVDIEYNFDRIDFNEAVTSPDESIQKPRVVNKSLAVGQSDVDMNVPKGRANENTFAVIIANEDYQKLTDVEFAANDGRTFKEYCIKTLGLPEKNVHYSENATLTSMWEQVDWIRSIADMYDGDASLIFYYAGHGVPDESTRDAYLMPVDGNGVNVNIGYKLSELYAALSEHETRSTTVFLDACFSGAERSGDMLVAARGVAIKAKEEVPKGNLVVFSAAQGNETAYPYREKGHGLFTYFLLKKLQESKGDVSLGELSDYIYDNVRRHSMVENSKSQTPNTIPASFYGDSWRELKLNN